MPDRPVFLLTLHQPWATLMAGGLKRVETRSWRTSYVGLVAIHAGRNEDGLDHARVTPPLRRGIEHAAARLPDTWYPQHALGVRTLKDAMPLGAIVAVGYLRTMERTVRLAKDPAFAKELPYGNFAPGRWGWVFDHVIALHRPLPCRGAQGIRQLRDVDVADGLRSWWYEHVAETEPRYLQDLAAR